MILRILLIMGSFTFLFGCKDNSKKTVTETFQVDGDTITTKSTESADNLDASYQLSDLSPELKKHISEKLKEAELLIIKYDGNLPPSKYDANTIDIVFEKWRQSNDSKKESHEYVVEALGAALGQDIVNNLDCDWKLLTDQYGSDITVIHKKYKVNGFPFSSAEKAYTENRTGSFQSVKLIIKHHIQEAEKNGEIKERQ
jgi:hypothetical protein